MNRRPQEAATTEQVSFRLARSLMKRMREITNARTWPPPPSQTEIVSRGIELVLAKLERDKRDG